MSHEVGFNAKFGYVLIKYFIIMWRMCMRVSVFKLCY